MSMTFTKLFSSITESTIWTEPDHVRLVWITMLAMADSRGRVWASVPGLANRARVSVAHAASALERFQEPDQWSRTPDHEGRRIEVIDGGWRLLNHAKYRAIRDDEAIKESKRKYINGRRKEERESKAVELSRANAEAYSESDADADADAKTEVEAKLPTEGVPLSRPPSKGTKKRSPLPDDEWLKELAEDETYHGIDVQREFGKMRRWCEQKKKPPSRSRFINWLNNADRPLNGFPASGDSQPSAFESWTSP